MAKAKKRAPKKRESSPGSVDRGSFQNKLSVKTVCGDVKKLFGDAPEEGDEIALMTIYGVARDFKQKDSGEKGIWTAFMGDFKAVRTSDGMVYRSAKCFLPSMATELLLSALTEAKRQSDEAVKAGQPAPVPAIEFAFEIGATFDPTVNVRYRYSCEPLMNQTSDALSRIETSIQKALPAPVS